MLFDSGKRGKAFCEVISVVSSDQAESAAAKQLPEPFGPARLLSVVKRQLEDLAIGCTKPDQQAISTGFFSPSSNRNFFSPLFLGVEVGVYWLAFKYIW